MQFSYNYTCSILILNMNVKLWVGCKEYIKPSSSVSDVNRHLSVLRLSE